MLPIGTKVYYTGDVANLDGHFVVIAHRNGHQYDLCETGGLGANRRFLGVMHIAEVYAGHCGERFVTEVARAKFRDAKIREMELDARRVSYLKHQADLSA